VRGWEDQQKRKKITKKLPRGGTVTVIRGQVPRLKKKPSQRSKLPQKQGAKREKGEKRRQNNGTKGEKGSRGKRTGGGIQGD